jgi:hypothetical protein
MSDAPPTPPNRERAPITHEGWIRFFAELQLIQMRQEERRKTTILTGRRSEIASEPQRPMEGTPASNFI